MGIDINTATVTSRGILIGSRRTSGFLTGEKTLNGVELGLDEREDVDKGEALLEGERLKPISGASLTIKGYGVC